MIQLYLLIGLATEDSERPHSYCYAVNSLPVGTTGSIAVCISPLTAIMVEQTTKFNNLGVVTEFVGEAQTNPDAQRRVLRGEVQIVLISPENMILNSTYRNMLLSEKYRQRLIALVVDEAHCVKTWLINIVILSSFIKYKSFVGGSVPQNVCFNWAATEFNTRWHSCNGINSNCNKRYF